MRIPKFEDGTDVYNGPQIYATPNTDEGYYLPDYYAQLAKEKRDQYWRDAAYYMKTPSIPNVINALKSVWNALPINTTSMTVNPNVNMGEAPTPGGKDWSSIQKILAARKAASVAKKIKTPSVRIGKSPYEGLTKEQIEIKRQQLSEIGKKGGQKSAETRNERVLKSQISAARKEKIRGLVKSDKEATKLNPNSKPSMYSRPGRIYNNGAITVNDIDI